MLNARDVAEYFLGKGRAEDVFTSELISINGQSFIMGSARLNAYLHLARNIYLAGTGELLFEDALYAESYGAVVPSVHVNYQNLIREKSNVRPTLINDAVKEFLDCFYTTFQSAAIDELIELSHEDAEWREKSRNSVKAERVMGSCGRKNEYRIQYQAIYRVIAGIAV